MILRYKDQEQILTGGERMTTNNRMELRAAIEALAALKVPCRVRLHTDSLYLKEGISTWIAVWKQNQWRTASRGAVKNKDLWQRLDQLQAAHEITWHWIKGHTGHPDNERVDELARSAVPTERM